MDKEHWVRVFGVVWDGLWGGLGIFKASESKIDSRQSSEVSQVMEAWGCKQHCSRGALREREQPRQIEGKPCSGMDAFDDPIQGMEQRALG